MWENLDRVDWGRLTHAYGWATDAPAILRKMVSPDEAARAKGWDGFWGSLNHQGDFYDSTVAAIPFLIGALAHPEVPDRVHILTALRQRWLDAPEYGGDPLVPEPPGGVDEPTPMLGEGELPAPRQAADDSDDGEDAEEFDLDSYRRMDLCAWQTGRAIQAGRPTFERLLEDPDREVAAASASLLLMWPATRAAAKRALVRMVEEEPDPIAQARSILELGVYGSGEDVGRLARWIAPDRPVEVRAAAALVWAWVVNPEPLPKPVAAALAELSAPDCAAFARLPRVGVYHRGPWVLPANAAELIVRFAENKDKELRWRAVQGLALWHEPARHVPAARAVPVLIRRLADPYNRIRDAAALALAERGEAVFDIDPEVVPALIRALEPHESAGWGDSVPSLDAGPSACGHAARLLAALSARLTASQREAAAAGIERAARRYKSRADQYVHFHMSGIQAAPFLKEQRDRLLAPREPTPAVVFAESAFPNKEERRWPLAECDRRLADAYRRDPQRTVAEAAAVLREAKDRDGAIGAALWLMTLGPAAQPALEALDACATGELDDYARGEVRSAGESIRQSLLVTPQPGAAVNPAKPSPRERIAWLARAQRDNALTNLNPAELVSELFDWLNHADAYVRAVAGALLAAAVRHPGEVRRAAQVLEKLLGDDAAVEVGITEEFEYAGRLYHWRRERYSPRDAAVRGLFALGHVPADGRLFTAMLTESTQPAAVCGRCAIPCRFPIPQWGLAVEAAGGLSACEPLLRAARQECRNTAWHGDQGPYVGDSELAEVIRVLSGRLV